MRFRQATVEDAKDMAALIWLDTSGEEPTTTELIAFTDELVGWWGEQAGNHRSFVAETADQKIVGMAWIALQPRVPRPGDVRRHIGDVQTLFVLPEYRGGGIGSRLVEEATTHAMKQGAARVTVHSGSRAMPIFERLGFRLNPRLLQRSLD